MATANGADQSYGPVLDALRMMSSNLDRAQKGEAHQFLEQFQKSVSQCHLLDNAGFLNLHSKGRSMDCDIFNATIYGHIG